MEINSLITKIENEFSSTQSVILFDCFQFLTHLDMVNLDKSNYSVNFEISNYS